MFYILSAILLTTLLTLAWFDFRTYRLPDFLTLPLILTGLLQAWLYQGNWEGGFFGALIGYCFFVSIEIGFRHLRGKEGLGRGDAKLLAAGGAWCGWMGLPFIVLIASGSGLIALMLPTVRKKAAKGRIPFGPFLAFAIFMVWISVFFAAP